MSNKAQPENILAFHGSNEFNSWLMGHLKLLSSEVEKELGSNLVALLLGGGYGRGEGGVVEHEQGQRPFNDLDLTLVVRDIKSLDNQKLLAISRKYAQKLLIHVDFSRPLTPKKLANLPRFLVWKELLEGYICLAGDCAAVEKNKPPWLLEPLPIIEASKLLLNRGAGLLWAQRVVKGVELEPDNGFVERNYYKCALSLGDSLLIAHKKHQTPYQGRDENLENLSHENKKVAELGLLDLYKKALGFKFRPDKAPHIQADTTTLEHMAKLWEKVFLHIETLRCGQNFIDIVSYTKWRGIRESLENNFTNWPRNILRNLQLGKLSLIYPRERLYRILPGLLGLENAPNNNWNIESKDFLKVWERFN